MPASSAYEVSIILALNPLRSAQRRYMRSSICAKSAASTPPAPERIVTTAERSSYSPSSSVWISMSSRSCRMLPISDCASASVSASSSSRPSSTSVSTSSMRWLAESRRLSCDCAADRRLVTFCAFSGSSHRPGADACTSRSWICALRRSTSNAFAIDSYLARASPIAWEKSNSAIVHHHTVLIVKILGNHCPPTFGMSPPWYSDPLSWVVVLAAQNGPSRIMERAGVDAMALSCAGAARCSARCRSCGTGPRWRRSASCG